jgi:hypothetical protein
MKRGQLIAPKLSPMGLLENHLAVDTWLDAIASHPMGLMIMLSASIRAVRGDCATDPYAQYAQRDHRLLLSTVKPS